MRTDTIIFSMTSLVIGVGLGFACGYYVRDKRAKETETDLFESLNEIESELSKLKKETKETKEKPQTLEEKVENEQKEFKDYVEETNTYQIIKPKKKKKKNQTKISEINTHKTDYSGYISPIEKKVKEDQQIEEDEIQAREDRSWEDYMKRKGKSIDVMGNSPLDPEYPDIQYDREDLVYLIPEDIVADINGKIVDRDSLLGNKLTRFGWYDKDDVSTFIWVRNNPKEIDYKIEKINMTYADYFGEEVPEDDALKEPIEERIKERDPKSQAAIDYLNNLVEKNKDKEINDSDE